MCTFVIFNTFNFTKICKASFFNKIACFVGFYYFQIWLGKHLHSTVLAIDVFTVISSIYYSNHLFGTKYSLHASEILLHKYLDRH